MTCKVKSFLWPYVEHVWSVMNVHDHLCGPSLLSHNCTTVYMTADLHLPPVFWYHNHGT